MRATALWVVGPGLAELRTEDLGEAGPDDVVVEADFSAVSRGTETLVLAGKVPAALHDTMRAPFQQGRFPWPVKYGYCSVGRIVGGAGPVGRSVFCLHPHQDRYVVPATAVHPLPGGLEPGLGVLAANLETAVNVTWDAQVGPGDRITVIGGGVVGCLVGWLMGCIPGADVQIVDLRPEVEALARALGVGFALPDHATGDRDCVVEASGSPAALTTALALAGIEGTVVVASWYGDQPVTAPLGGAFHSRRLTLRSSQVGRIGPSRSVRFSFARRLAVALDLLARAPELEVLIDSEGDLSSLPADLVRLAGAPGSVLCHRVRYGE